VTIKYTDVFGEEFKTVHVYRDGRDFVGDFEVIRSEVYLKGKPK